MARDTAAIAERAHHAITGRSSADAAQNHEAIAANEQRGNALMHVVSLTATKTGDALIDPKLVLAWLMGALGAPVLLIGLLVPLRESLALLPQIVTAPWVKALAQRKWVWVGGSAVQGAGVIAMGLAALVLDGVAAGVAIVAALAVFALARSLCSVSYKDVLGKTVATSTRGSVTGTAGSLASAGAFAFAVGIAAGLIPLTVTSIALVLFVAGILWFSAALLFARLQEPVSGGQDDGARDGDSNNDDEAASGLRGVLAQARLLRDDPQLLRFIVVRALLTTTALAPPFIIALSGGNSAGQIDQLGAFLVASSLAAVVSSAVWGRLSDTSSRRVLIAASLVAATGFAVLTSIGLIAPARAESVWFVAPVFFAVMIAYQGVRLGRSTHLVDMASQDDRAAYTALSNTIIGIVLLLGAGFGLIGAAFGPVTVLATFAVLCLVAAVGALGLQEVQAAPTA